MNHLIYVSQAVKPMDEAALADLLTHSRARNAESGITGLLVYRHLPELKRGNFLQILEGPAPALEEVWHRISRDSRHHSVIVLEEGTAPERMFADWSMGLRTVDPAMLRGFDGFTDLGSDAFWDRARARGLPGALELLRSFYEPA